MVLTFWLQTNNQMFGNQIDPIQTAKQVTLSHHLIKDVSLSRSALVYYVITFACIAFTLCVYECG